MESRRHQLYDSNCSRISSRCARRASKCISGRIRTACRTPRAQSTFCTGPTRRPSAHGRYWTGTEQFNKLANVVDTATDVKERHKAFQAMLDIFEDEMPMTILYNPLYSYASKKRVDWKPLPLFYMDFRPDVFRVR